MKTYLCVLVVAAAGCSDSVKCAPGTFSHDGNCYAYDPTDKTPPTTTVTPAGGRSRNPVPDHVTLTASEPATIHFTTDGSDPDPTMGGAPSPVTVPDITSGTTLKFFSVDAAGNTEMTQTATFVTDTTPPDPVAGLALTVTGGTSSLAWTNPTASDFAGTIVARIDNVIDVNPTPGMIYSSPTMLSPSVKMLQIGTQVSASEPGVAHGVARYAVWSFDDLGNYSIPAVVETDVGPLTTNGTFTFNTANSQLTKTSPSDFDLSGTTASLSGTTLTLDLSVKNLTTSFLQNPKVEITAVQNATLASSDGTADGNAFKSLGNAALAPAATATSTATFNNATATVTINVTIAHHPAVMGAVRPTQSATARQVVETGGGLEYAESTLSTPGPTGRAGGTNRPGIVVAGRYLDLPSSHGIERWDLTTQMQVGGLSLAVSSTRGAVLSLFGANGREYAIVKGGGRRRGGTLAVVVLDEALHVLDTIELPVMGTHGSVLSALSADNKTLAVPGDDSIALVDLVHGTLIDADPSTPAIDMFDPKFPGGRIRSVAFFSNDQGLVATLFTNTTPNVAVIKRTAQGYTSTVSTTGGGKSQSLLTGPDGRVWIGTDTALSVYDPQTDQITTTSHASGVIGMTVSQGTLWALRTDRRTVDALDTNGAVTRSITLPASVYGHWLQATDEP
jgi:hypothetical protein